MRKRRITTGLLALLAMLPLMTMTTTFAADAQIYSMTTDGGGNTVSNSAFLAQSFWTGSNQVTLSTGYEGANVKMTTSFIHSVSFYDSVIAIEFKEPQVRQAIHVGNSTTGMINISRGPGTI